MEKRKEEEPKLDRSALSRRAESFRTLIEIDDSQFGVVLTAFNDKSIMALLQILMVMYKERVSGFVVRREPKLIANEMGDLVGSVFSKGFIEQMTKGTRLKERAPEKVGDWPDKKLSSWECFNFKPKDPTMGEEVKSFVLEIVIDGVVDKFPVSGANADSVIALLTAATCDKMPRISGWNLYDDSGAMIVSVPAIIFIGDLCKISPLSKLPADPKSAGWRAMPAVVPTSEEWISDIEKAKKGGRKPS